MYNDVLLSIRRTIVPIVVGMVAGSFLGPYVRPDELEAVVNGVISIVYYTVLRLIEARVPNVGALLGARKQPVYFDAP